MKHDIADKWVAALRSGKYKQTTGYLKDSRGHCCLGVLCELYAKEHPGICAWKLCEVTTVRQVSGFHADKDFNNQILPLSVMKWAGMKTRTGKYSGSAPYEGGDLSSKNDQGCPFKLIAKIIEEYKDEL